MWTDSNLPYDIEDSEEPAVRARQIAESEAKRVAAECARLPDMRMDLVLDIRARIASGAYKISAQDLADAIIHKAQYARLCR
jgi:anti-sigma28 factor (negative regulator of flagellin synthesis)